ncbi:MAG TPA: FAD-binding oxidoreductase [Solirubrobacterales bacterium]
MKAGTDVAVIGAGIVGLSTAYALRARSASVTVYDRATPGSGQSGGDSRIFRHAHADRRLVEWARESRAIYRRWEEELGVELVSADGALYIGAAAAERLALIEAVGGIDARRVDADEIVARMPLLGPREVSALFDADGGAIRAAGAVAALAGALGERFVGEEAVAVVPRPEGTVAVFTGGGRFEHGAAVVCAGTSTAAIARGLGITIPLRVTLHGRVAFELRGAPPAQVACLTDTTYDFDEADTYGVASPDRTRFSIGVAETLAREDLSLLAPEAIGEADDRAAAYVARALPGLDPTPAGHRHCWVTELPWHEDGVAVWEAGPVLLLAGNNLFKHAPALGEALATATLDGTLRDDLRPTSRLGAPA